MNPFSGFFWSTDSWTAPKEQETGHAVDQNEGNEVSEAGGEGREGARILNLQDSMTWAKSLQVPSSLWGLERALCLTLGKAGRMREGETREERDEEG